MSKSITQAFADIYLSPAQLYAGLAQSKGWSWLPFLLMLLLPCIGIYWFFSGMSPHWIVEQQLLHAGDLTPAELEQSRAIMGQMADKTVYISMVAILIVTPLMLALLALYFKLVGNSGNARPYGDWYAFAVWSSMPNLINSLGFLVILALSSTPELPLNLYNYASVNQLLLNLQPGDAWFNWADNLNLFTLWTLVLATIGLKTWSGYATAKAALLAALPAVLIFGLWALFI